MAKKHKIQTPDKLAVETIWWHDAGAVTRAKVDPEPMIFVNTGMVVAENAIEVLLSYSLEALDDWNTENHEGYKIPRGMIIKRIRHGYIDVVPAEVPAYKERVNEEVPSVSEESPKAN